MNYTVAIIVPVYNVGKYLDECISSLVNQTYDNLEIILVDDGATDNSGTICDDWAKRDSRIKVIHKENGGLVSAWKTGLANAFSNWVSFVDGDDWIEEEHIEHIVKKQHESKADIVVTPMKQVAAAKEWVLETIADYKTYAGESLTSELYPILLNAGGFETRGVPCSRCGKLIRKENMQKNIHYCNERATYEEDMSIMFPTMMDAKCICITKSDKAYYCYRLVGDSMLHGYDKNMLNSLHLVYRNLYQAVADKETDFFIKQIHIELFNAFIRCLSNELQNPDGYDRIKKNVKNLCKDKMLVAVKDIVTYKNYPVKFKLLAKILVKGTWTDINILLPMMLFAKRLSQ